ncbi:hypothetical protein CONPUDRAFT_152797 [Coniophora puteana RWD-64-598 SS2]|uniref:Uncharacterized protein n=1 Tax=Coniophora puteana (strain RWD-64-598) TaxID=741705 RepID=A0A5M3MRW7_CONPW|nr:uncharacterized protein CONPUDRAFT_152797 [Coniophora puteana RWD-64-598 SS2]EIW81898.1 hypothetical protein CONPUDRAFT_152797 [Coniophora puteana RWD-64-598 SS2]
MALPLPIIDDRDAQISWSEHWWQAGVSPEYDGTSTGSNRTGDTVTFTFTGTWVSVYGMVGRNSYAGLPTSSYAIDGGRPTVFEPLAMEDSVYRYQMFSSDILDDGVHTLIINNITTDCTVPGTNGTICLIWLDFIEYMPSSTELLSNQSSPSSPTSSPSPTTLHSTFTSSSNHTSARTIAGSAIGGFVALSLLAASALLIRYYRMKIRMKQDMIDSLITARPYQQIIQEPQVRSEYSWMRDNEPRVTTEEPRVSASAPPPYGEGM